MKRDMDLIRSMLLLIEGCPDVPPKTLRLDSFLDLISDVYIISLHIELLREAGFIEARGLSVDNGVKNYEISRITFAGYEYLESIKDAKIWRNVKEKIFAVGGVTFDIAKNIAEAEIMKMLQI